MTALRNALWVEDLFNPRGGIFKLNSLKASTLLHSSVNYSTSYVYSCWDAKVEVGIFQQTLGTNCLTTWPVDQVKVPHFRLKTPHTGTTLVDFKVRCFWSELGAFGCRMLWMWSMLRFIAVTKPQLETARFDNVFQATVDKVQEASWQNYRSMNNV